MKKFKEIEVCPFRVCGKTEVSCTVKGESYKTEYFAQCLKMGCPAFVPAELNLIGTIEDELCLRIEQIKLDIDEKSN